jgi:uncharacterized membrane protein SirB2
MIEFYAEIRQAHIAAAMGSGGLFLLRGILVRAGRGDLALAPLPRYLSYAVDTVLLTAALMLLSILPSAAFSNGWLTAKLALLPVYIVAGWVALRRAGAGWRRHAYFAAAIVAYGCIFAIARTHDPLGPIRVLSGG